MALKPFSTRLRERFEHGVSSYGDSTTRRVPPVDLLEALREEAADIAGWAWVVSVRTTTYDEPTRSAIALDLARLGRVSVSIFSHLVELDWLFTSRTVQDVEAGETSIADLEALVNDLLARAVVEPMPDPVAPRPGVIKMPRSAVIRDWMRMTGMRAEAGRNEYGDASFDREATDLVVELGDELVAIVGWCAVLLHRSTPTLFEETLADVRTRLAAIAGMAHVAYQRLPATYHLAAEGLGAPPPREQVDAVPTVRDWLEHAVMVQFRSVTAPTAPPPPPVYDELADATQGRR